MLSSKYEQCYLPTTNLSSIELIKHGNALAACCLAFCLPATVAWLSDSNITCCCRQDPGLFNGASRDLQSQAEPSESPTSVVTIPDPVSSLLNFYLAIWLEHWYVAMQLPSGTLQPCAVVVPALTASLDRHVVKQQLQIQKVKADQNKHSSKVHVKL